MVFESFHVPTKAELENSSSLELRTYYSANASINTNLSTPSIPPTIPKVFEDTIAITGERTARMAVSQYQGVLQNFLVGLVNAKRILEIGTFTGSSAIFFANALKRNGVKPTDTDKKPVIGLDISDTYAEVARSNFASAGVEDYIEIVVGDARESLAQLEGQTFDVIFLDADKLSYRQYYDTILEKNILSENGIIIADNTAFDCVTPFINIPVPVPEDAKPLDVPFGSYPESSEFGKGVHEFNEYLRKDPRCEAVMLPIATGITLIRRINNTNNN
ncbi:hypothetical protein IW140_000264 [Coemansia sp. RSA 1813]|nr:hypothetical protein EV178_000467 [Coemansia sp. RSA 1646]KAJ1773764.1 hypothetical protein LPJ74_000307 [Coemansia sp. RSA 1843]KAJ2093726.1 hypothetical protein IW138_000121 [Coemansia sp. RSA 986]KAJ2217938.1 hypothetical protein EV179_000082 [Coemansia sp. RSA 487]KAJ2573220.1 hypothetical protein IW140_000264 [Coemansia sp. RSA 1813]